MAALSGDLPPRAGHALANLSALFLGNRCENVGQLRHPAALCDRVDSDAKVVQFFPGTRALQHAAPQAVKPLDHDDNVLTLAA